MGYINSPHLRFGTRIRNKLYNWNENGVRVPCRKPTLLSSLNITLILLQTYPIPTVSLYPFILRINFIHSLQGCITIQNNQVSFHPRTTTIIYTNTKNILKKSYNVSSHQTNKIEEQKDSILNSYFKQLKMKLN